MYGDLYKNIWYLRTNCAILYNLTLPTKSITMYLYQMYSSYFVKEGFQLDTVLFPGNNSAQAYTYRHNELVCTVNRGKLQHFNRTGKTASRRNI